MRTLGYNKKDASVGPQITVVTVVYNRVKELLSTIESVLTQTYSNVEYIVVDGGSTDGTIELLYKYNNRITYWLSEPDNGIYDAMNKATLLAKGNWINYMNAGDRFYNNTVLEKLFSRHLDADIVYGNALIQRQDFQTSFDIHPVQEMWKHSPFCHQAAFIRSDLIKKMLYDVSYRIGADHDFFYRAYRANQKFLHVDDIICIFDGQDGATKKQITLAIKEKMAIAIKYDFSLAKKLYYELYLFYIALNQLVKKIVGPKFTNLVIRLMRRKKN